MALNDIVNFYESQLKTYDDTNSHFEIYYLEFNNWIQKHLSNKSQLVMDLGCGTGTVSMPLKNIHNIYGIDASFKFLKIAKNKISNNFNPICGTITNLPIKSRSIDSVFSFGVLDQIDNLDDVFDEIIRILKPGGMFLFDTSPFPLFDIGYFIGLYGRKGMSGALKGILNNRIELTWSIKNDDGKMKTIRVYRYRPSHIEQVLALKGFKIVDSRGFHISKMIIPEKIHVNSKSRILAKIDHSFFRKIDDKLNHHGLLNKHGCYLMYACVKRD